MIASKRILPYVVIVSLSVVVAVFFIFFYSYHLFHREQYSLFMMDSEFVRQTIENGSFVPDAWLSTLAGGFLTQFYFYIYAGPAIVSAVIMAIGLLCYMLLTRIGLDWKWSLVVSIAFMLWETGRECINEYPLASSLSLMFGFVLGNMFPLKSAKWFRVALWVVVLVFGWWAVGYGTAVALVAILVCYMRAEIVAVLMCISAVVASASWSFMLTHWYGYPNMSVERLFEIDTKYNWGRDVEDLVSTEDMEVSQIGNYYKMLASAKKSEFTSEINWQTMTPFLPVDPSGNYLSITMAGNVWYELGDMTMAEHATMLGMIFSPYNKGTRHLRRLAEINIINGDENAANKYLHMLSQTIPHKRWAESRMKSNRTDSYNAMLENKRSFIPSRDVLRSSVDYRKSLCNLLDANINNELARRYLFAWELKNKDVTAFADDYLKYGKGTICRQYAEALLIAYMNSPSDIQDRIMKIHIPSAVLSEFTDFNKLYESQDMAALKLKYKDTYWFYCKFCK